MNCWCELHVLLFTVGSPSHTVYQWCQRRSARVCQSPIQRIHIWGNSDRLGTVHYIISITFYFTLWLEYFQVKWAPVETCAFLCIQDVASVIFYLKECLIYINVNCKCHIVINIQSFIGCIKCWTCTGNKWIKKQLKLHWWNHLTSWGPVSLRILLGNILKHWNLF